MARQSSVYPVDVDRKTPIVAALLVPGVSFLNTKITVTEELLQGSSGLFRVYFALVTDTVDQEYQFEIIKTRQGGQFGFGADATAVIANGGVIGATMNSTGNGYPIGTSAPVTIVAFDNTGTGGSGAVATANIVRGKIVSLTITNPGTGYVTAPIINITSTAYLATGSRLNGDNTFILRDRAYYRFDIGVRAGDILDFILQGSQNVNEIIELRVDQIQIGA